MVEDDSQMDSPLVRFHLVFRRREPISAQPVARPNPAVNSSLPHCALDRLWVPPGQQALSCCYESVTPKPALVHYYCSLLVYSDPYAQCSLIRSVCPYLLLLGLSVLLRVGTKGGDKFSRLASSCL